MALVICLVDWTELIRRLRTLSWPPGMVNFRCLRPELYRPREGLFLNRRFRFLHQVVLELPRLLQMTLQILQSLQRSLGEFDRGHLHLLFLKKLSLKI